MITRIQKGDKYNREVKDLHFKGYADGDGRNVTSCGFNIFSAFDGP
jgi:hypothetical protein